MEVQLPDDLLSRVFLAGLPAPDDDGYLPSRDLAKLCYSFGSCSRSWLTAMKKALSALAPKLLCSGSDAELAWLRTIPASSAKFTYQEDRQGLCWSQGKGFAVVTGFTAGEQGLEVRRKDVLEGLPHSLPHLLIDFPDSAADLSWVPTKRGLAGARLRGLTLRSAGDVFLGEGTLGALCAAAGEVTVEAPRVGVSVGEEEEEEEGGGEEEPPAAMRSGPGRRLYEALGLAIAEVATAEVALARVVALGKENVRQQEQEQEQEVKEEAAQCEKAADAVAAGEEESAENGAGGAENCTCGAENGVDAGGEAGSSLRLARLRLVCKDATLLQVSGACTTRVSVVQQAQRAGVETWARRAGLRGSAELRPLHGRKGWFALDITSS